MYGFDIPFSVSQGAPPFVVGCGVFDCARMKAVSLSFFPGLVPMLAGVWSPNLWFLVAFARCPLPGALCLASLYLVSLLLFPILVLGAVLLLVVVGQNGAEGSTSFEPPLRLFWVRVPTSDGRPMSSGKFLQLAELIPQRGDG